MAEKFSNFLAGHTGMEEEEFTSRYDHGFLLIYPIQEGEDEGKVQFQTMAGGNIKDLVGANDADPDLFLLSKPGAHAYTMITLGRTANNDVHLDNGAISKMHAYFKKDDKAGFNVTDAGSTNGTVVNGATLFKDEPKSLRGGETITFGNCFQATFHTPTTMWRYLSLVQRLK